MAPMSSSSRINRNAEQGAVGDDLLSAKRLLRVRKYIGDLNGVAGECDAADHGCAVACVWMLNRSRSSTWRESSLRSSLGAGIRLILTLGRVKCPLHGPVFANVA